MEKTTNIIQETKKQLKKRTKVPQRNFPNYQNLWVFKN